MSQDFTIIVANDGTNTVRPTSVRVVGQELETLSGLFETLESSGADLTTSSDIKDWSTWGSDAEKAIDDLLNGLSFRLWDGDTETEQLTLSKLEPGKKISDYVTLRFVFEKPGEMVVPVPAHSQIKRGKAHAPLGLPDIYSGLISESMIDTLLEELDELRNDPSAPAEFSGLNASQFEAVSVALRLVQKRLKNEAKKNFDNIFLAQLGDYSVRQCHS